MKAKLTINGKEFEVDISEEELKNLNEQIECKTGYERIFYKPYYFTNIYDEIVTDYDDGASKNNKLYELANYYLDKTVVENNARADRLLRQIRRFSAEHRKQSLDWTNKNKSKYYIYYDYQISCCSAEGLLVEAVSHCRNFGQVYFDSQETAQLAIDTFKDDLVWYFTEYKDSL